MTKVIGNRIAVLINEKIEHEHDPEGKRQQIFDDIHKFIRPNRLSGLIKGTRKLNVDEVMALKDYFGCTAAEEVLLMKKSK